MRSSRLALFTFSFVPLFAACDADKLDFKTDAERSEEDTSVVDASASDANGITPIDAAIADAGTDARAPYVAPADILARPFMVYAPKAAGPHPLLILLHGYAGSATGINRYFAFSAGVDTRNHIVAVPQGTANKNNERFWNASDACCNVFGDNVDDVTYLTHVIEDVQARFSVDPKSIYIMGHSNGGFMAYRMACEKPALISAIVSVAGAVAASGCPNGSPARVLQIHGTNDATIKMAGGTLFGLKPYLATRAGLERFSSVTTNLSYATCGGPYDLDNGITGAETTSVCLNVAAPKRTTLWTIAGGTHGPNFGAGLVDNVWTWLRTP